jgi:hypothetical protein
MVIKLHFFSNISDSNNPKVTRNEKTVENCARSSGKVGYSI